METITVFDKLVAELTAEERRDLLRKIRNSEYISDVPLYVKTASEGDEESPIEERFRNLGFWSKIAVFIRAFFSGKKPVDAFEDRLFARLAANIAQASPGIMDSRRGILLEAFALELENLKNSARFFYDYLQVSIDKQRPDFYAFLVSIEFEDIHKRLLEETDPFAFAEKNESASERDVKEAVNSAYAEIIGGFNNAQRTVMYANVRALSCLKALASFPFEETLKPFGALETGGPRVCYVYLIQDRLLELANVLASFKEPPAVSIFESLIVFALQDRLQDGDFDMSAILKENIQRADEALASIRQFNARVPLKDILRFCTRDLFFRPKEITGGEDWHAVYKSFWKNRVDSMCGRFFQERKRVSLEAELVEFSGKLALDRFDFAVGTGDGASVVRRSLALDFLSTFAGSVFLDEVNRPLKVLLLEGEFYKKENRTEFTDSYNVLLALREAVRALDGKLDPSGAYGKARDEATKEISALTRKRLLQELTRTIEAEIEGIVKSAGVALKAIESVLGGVLHGQVGGKYDSVSNLGYLDGKNNRGFIKALDRARTQCGRAAALLEEALALESRVFPA